MDNTSIQRLTALNIGFYHDNLESFSGTRKAPWKGWERVAGHLAGRSCSRVLDIACGNLRFERFLESETTSAIDEFVCVDACAPLMGVGGVDAKITRIERDVIDALMRGDAFISDGDFDLAVSFGFLHHVPTGELRVSLMNALVRSVRPGGLVACSFWRFADDEELGFKARRVTDRACSKVGAMLDANDYLIGWDGGEDSLRYCHSFTDQEIDDIVGRVSGAELVDRFGADGRNAKLNEYLVFEAS